MVLLLLGLAAGIWSRASQPGHPAVLNEATEAREIRPFTTSPDPRFAPLPYEEERH